MSRVVITGRGTVNPLGLDVQASFAGLLRGQTAIGPLDFPDVGRLSVRIGAAVPGFDAADHLPPGRLAQLDPFARLAVVAARQALKESGLEPGVWATQAGVIIGTAGGGLQSADLSYRMVYEAGKNRVPPLTVPRLMANAAPAAVASDLGLWGPGWAVSTACASSAHALAQAAALVASGTAPVMLAGGAEAMLCFAGVKAWEALRVLSETGCRPFAADRDGMVMGDGAAIYVLEDRDHALARGAVIHAELAGWAMGADAGDLVQPSTDGAVRVMQAALDHAGLAPDAIGLVKAHGTATAANDRSEALALQRVFGHHPPPVTAPKALHGHLIGAAGAVELLTALLALETGLIAPTAAVEPDPALGIDLVTKTPRTAPVDAVLCNAFAFGGLNAALVLRRG